MSDIADARRDIEEALLVPATGRLADPDRVIGSLAVLPFENASGDPQMEYLSEGLTENIIFSLSHLPHLRVMSRSAVFRYKGRIEQALDKARAENRLLVLGLHGGTTENGELQAMCELRKIPFTGSGSASSHLAFDKVAAKRFAAIAGVKAPAGVMLEDIEKAFAQYGKLIAKPVRDGSSYGLIFVNAKQDIVAVRRAAKTEEYLIEPLISGAEATCGVQERLDGSLVALPPVEIIPAEGAFDYRAKYLAKATQEICPARFAPEISAQIMEQALRAHLALSCRGYSRTDFIVSAKGPIYLETNTLPGLTKASLYPKALKAQGIEFPDFLKDQILLAQKRAGK